MCIKVDTEPCIKSFFSIKKTLTFFLIKFKHFIWKIVLNAFQRYIKFKLLQTKKFKYKKLYKMNKC